jgi:hypothetical protein
MTDQLVCTIQGSGGAVGLVGAANAKKGCSLLKDFDPYTIYKSASFRNV